MFKKHDNTEHNVIYVHTVFFVLNIDLRVEKQQHYHLMGVYYSGDMVVDCEYTIVLGENFFLLFIQK